MRCARIVWDSGESGRSQNGVVGAEGRELRYAQKRADKSAALFGYPHSANA